MVLLTQKTCSPLTCICLQLTPAQSNMVVMLMYDPEATAAYTCL